MSLEIETAVIPVAGVGTRMLPATWGIEKCMLPIYTTSVKTVLILDWMLDECSKGGIKRVIFITTERGRRQIKNYLEEIDFSLIERFNSVGKNRLVELEMERRAAYGIKYEYVIQGPGPYGSTVGPYLARHLLEGEKKFLVFGGDDIVYHRDPEESEIKLALKAWEESDCENMIMGSPEDREHIQNLGFLSGDENNVLTHWIEKPMADQLPEQDVFTANISRYGFSDSIWEYIEEEMNTHRDGEHLITYPILRAVEGGKNFCIHQIQGKYLGGGTAAELIEAGRYINENPPYDKQNN